MLVFKGRTTFSPSGSVRIYSVDSIISEAEINFLNHFSLISLSQFHTHGCTQESLYNQSELSCKTIDDISSSDKFLPQEQWRGGKKSLLSLLTALRCIPRATSRKMYSFTALQCLELKTWVYNVITVCMMCWHTWNVVLENNFYRYCGSPKGQISEFWIESWKESRQLKAKQTASILFSFLKSTLWETHWGVVLKRAEMASGRPRVKSLPIPWKLPEYPWASHTLSLTFHWVVVRLEWRRGELCKPL